MPIIGWKALLAGDLLVHRQNSKTFKKLLTTAAQSLTAGNCLVAFPEGTRSKDGRLSSFKRGPFMFAQKAGVKVCYRYAYDYTYVKCTAVWSQTYFQEQLCVHTIFVVLTHSVYAHVSLVCTLLLLCQLPTNLSVR